jgi:hypothetical protein
MKKMSKMLVGIAILIMIVSLSGCISAGMKAEITYRVGWMTNSSSISDDYKWYVTAAIEPEDVKYDENTLPETFVYNKGVTPNVTLYAQDTFEVNLPSSRNFVVVYVYADANGNGKLDSGDYIGDFDHWYPSDAEDPEYMLKFYTDF